MLDKIYKIFHDEQDLAGILSIMRRLANPVKARALCPARSRPAPILYEICARRTSRVELSPHSRFAASRLRAGRPQACRSLQGIELSGLPAFLPCASTLDQDRGSAD